MVTGTFSLIIEGSNDDLTWDTLIVIPLNDINGGVLDHLIAAGNYLIKCSTHVSFV